MFYVRFSMSLSLFTILLSYWSIEVNYKCCPFLLVLFKSNLSSLLVWAGLTCITCHLLYTFSLLIVILPMFSYFRFWFLAYFTIWIITRKCWAYNGFSEQPSRRLFFDFLLIVYISWNGAHGGAFYDVMMFCWTCHCFICSYILNTYWQILKT